MDKKDLKFLYETFLFRDIRPEDAEPLLRDEEFCVHICRKGERVTFKNEIAFVQSGECEVICDQSGHDILILNNLKKGDSFGILSIFTDEPYITAVIAKKDTRILSLRQESLLRWIEHSSALAMNVIRFLAGRVSFLNRKVATLGSSTVEEKCVSYLRDEFRKKGNTVDFPVSRVARKLGVGRASLYRAISSLYEQGIISHEGGFIKILMPNFFE